MAAELVVTPGISFYLDWKFWSFAVSLSAFAISILPHLKQFKRARIDCEVYQKIHVSHKVGNPNAQMHIILTNAGGRRIRLKALSLTFKRAGETEFSLIGGTYQNFPTDKDSLLLTPLSLKPGDEWARTVNFYAEYSQHDQRLYKAIENTLRKDVNAKLAALPNEPSPDVPPVVGDAENVAPFMDFYNRKFKWFAGEYEVTLSVIADIANVMAPKRMRTTIFESDSSDMEEFKENYATGRGLWWGPAEPGVVLELVDKP